MFHLPYLKVISVVSGTRSYNLSVAYMIISMVPWLFIMFISSVYLTLLGHYLAQSTASIKTISLFLLIPLGA
jgi:hypothetical protein